MRERCGGQSPLKRGVEDVAHPSPGLRTMFVEKAAMANYETQYDRKVVGQRQAVLTANFLKGAEPYLANEVPGLDLRVHQPNVFREAKEFLAETVGRLGRSALLPAPPNAGKSTMGALLTRLCGVGQELPGDPAGIKAITLAPRRVALQQIPETYARFAPDVRVARLDPEEGVEVFDRADVAILSYKRMLTMPEADWQILMANTTLAIADEAHRAIGLQSAARLEMTKEAGVTLLAMSASPQFDETRSVIRVLKIDRVFTEITPREAIHMGIANGVRLFALHSGETFDFTSRRDSITDADLEGLSANEPRNDLIATVMQDMANQGKFGIVHCAAGNKNEHAVTVAAIASTKKIVDPRTGKEREMVVKAVGNFQSDATNDEYIRGFKQRKIDGLTFNRYILEAFDDPIDYLIAATPTGSEVDIKQLTGRGARLHPGLTHIFVIMDRYRSQSAKHLWTPFEVYGEDAVRQGVVIANAPPANESSRTSDEALDGGRLDGGKKRSTPRQPEAYLQEHELSRKIREAMGRIPDGTVLEDLVLVRTEYDDPPQGYVPLIHLSAIREGLITPEGARYALTSKVDNQGRPLFISVRTGKYAQYVLPSANDVLQARYQDASEKISRLDISNFLASEGWPRPSFDTVIRACKAIEIKYEITKGVLYLEAADARKLLFHLSSVPLIDPALQVSLADLAQRLGLTTSSEFQNIRNQSRFEDSITKRRRGLPTSAYKIVDTIATEIAPEFLHTAAQTSPKITAALGQTGVKAVVAEVQTNAQREFWKLRLRTHIANTAIEAFIGSYRKPSVAMSTPAAAPHSPVQSSSPPPPLDDSYLLSYGEGWTKHALCNEAGVIDLFVSGRPDEQKKAKAICESCQVKGSCLQYDLKHPSGGIAGGFTARERKKLDSISILKWFGGQNS